jgi:hypothetical protein
MPRYQYAGAPATPPPPTLTIIAGTVATKVGTKYFVLQYRNRAGYSLVSSPIQSIAVGTNQGIRVGIPSSARPAPTGLEYGVDIKEYVILMGETNVLADMVIVATFPNNQVNGTIYSLPANIDLTTDNHLNVTALNVANIGALPLSPVHGMRRSVTTPSRFLAYDAIFAPTGWKDAYPQVFGTYLANAQNVNGSNRDISDIADTTVVLTPSYSCDASNSEGVTFWLVNDGTVNITVGARVGISVQMNGEDVSSLFVGLLQVEFLGYANVTTGALDTVGMTVGGAIPYQGDETNLELQKDLPPGFAFQIRIYADFNAFQLNNRVPQGSVILVSPFFYADFATFVPEGNVFGTFIAGEFGLRRVLPNGAGPTAKALKGTGLITVANGGGYKFTAGESLVLGLITNTASQQVIMSINGAVYTSTIVPDGTTIRAFVGTVDGYGAPTAFQGSVALNATKVLTINLTHATAVRADYPDVIAGNALGVFNATRVRAYVRPVGGGTILQFEALVTPATLSEVFTFGATAGTNIGVSLPAAPAADFGLYTPGAAVLGTSTVASTFTAGNYEVAIAYTYENTVTAISHDPLLGCVTELDTTLVEVLARTKFYGQPLANAAVFRALNPATNPNTQLRTHAGRKVPYMWQADSLGIDDNTENSKYYKPTALLITQPGRWVRVLRVDVGTVTVGSDETAIITTREDSGGTVLFDFTIPVKEGDRGVRGLRGPAGQMTVAGAEEVSVGEAAVINLGTTTNASLFFRIPVGKGPRGQRGKQGLAGAAGTLSNNSGVVFTNSAAPTVVAGESGLFSSGDLLTFKSSGGPTSPLALLATQQSFTAGQAIAPVTIASGSATPGTNCALSNNFYLTLTINSVLQNPTNSIDGQTIVWRFIQSGSFTLGFGSKFKFVNGVVPAASIGVNKVDRLSCVYDVVRDLWDCTYLPNYS